MSGDGNIYCEQLDPSTSFQISIVLLRGVTNGKTLKKKVMAGTLQCAIIKPALVADPFQVVVAANKAAVSFTNGSMVTKSIYTELLFNLSISKNISQSLIKFGFHEDDQDVLIATLDKVGVLSVHDVLSEIDGNVVPLSELQNICDMKLICKSYKVNEVEVKNQSFLDSIVSRIATSDFVSY